ncbi:MAG: hypothetical protein BWZ02_01936 [Lentisphaerae bacterium ADurb.BinA184]|nr:MAG: hypothetical protein BWZ02_01936 [Lentisphaerae bacterium ADurb.BinA184]
MTLGDTRIGELVEIPPVQTVVRLDPRRGEGPGLAACFVLTDDVTRHLDVLAEALARPTGQGYFLRGDFGSGKSHFLAALATWAAGQAGEGTPVGRHPGLARLAAAGRRLLPVAISLVGYRATTPLEQIVAEAIERALGERGQDVCLTPLASFNRRLLELCADPGIAGQLAAAAGIAAPEIPDWVARAPRDACAAGMRLMKSLGLAAPAQLIEERDQTFLRAMAAVRAAGGDGVLLLLDELSEFFRSKPDARRLNEDARALQFLGEFTAGQPLWIVAAVQEGLERTGDIAQATFRKIKDRFPVHLSLSALHIRDLIAGRLVRHRPGTDAVLADIHAYLRGQFPSFSASLAAFRDCYPVHPLTMELLEGLSDLFSQHRGIVDFVHYRLAGDPRRDIPGILERPCLELLAPDSIYEHFRDRLAEFSDFNVFPRRIVPHLDETIERVLEDPGDRELARRLVRILVLYRIHPTADPPAAGRLAELVGCVLAPAQPDMNVQFVTEAILDPVVAASRFLVRRDAPSGRPAERVYEIVAEENHAATFAARLDKAVEELGIQDTRPLLAILGELPESLSWPGRGVFGTGLARSVLWRSSPRAVQTLFCAPGGEAEARGHVLAAVAGGGADAAVVLALWGSSLPEFDGRAVAVWRLPPPADPDNVLPRWFAARAMAAELNPASPADAPLVPLARDLEARLRPLAERVALDTLFAGAFEGGHLDLDPVVCRLKRFDRLLDAAAEVLLEERYPRFAEIAPRGLAPSPRLYQRLLEELGTAGHLSLQEARRMGLTGAIEGLAVPLGLAEVRGGAYVVAPDPAAHPLLASLMQMLKPAGATPVRQVVDGLRDGPFGVPETTTAFLLAVLACRGALTLLNKGRAVPLDFIRLVTVDTVDAVAAGELIGPNERETLLNHCPFLLPPQDRESFGLRQQGEAWQGALRLKPAVEKLAAALTPRLHELTDFAAFAAFDLEAVRQKTERLRALADEIKVSYAARDGLERFLQAWRESGLDAADLERVRRFARFLERQGEQFLSVAYFLRHPAVARAAAADPALGELHARALPLLEAPDAWLEDDLRAVEPFEAFRRAYAQRYADEHARFYEAAKPALDRRSRRALDALRRLAAVESLDRPVGLGAVLEGADRPRRSCRYNVAEQLRRSPVCECGYEIGTTTPAADSTVPDEINRCLGEYAGILRGPHVREALRARAYALEEAAPETANALRRLMTQLSGDAAALPAALPDAADAVACQELSRALAGTVQVQRRSLSELVRRLRGRRLRESQVRELFEAWLGRTGAECVLAIEADDDTAAARPGGDDGAPWWRALHPELLSEAATVDVAAIAGALERLHPARGLRAKLASLGERELAQFAAGEAFHTQAVREAWLLLAERALGGRHRWPAPKGSGHADPATARAIDQRLARLQRICELRKAAFPERAELRIPLVAVACDGWCDEPVRRLVHAELDGLTARAADWLASLPAAPPIGLERPVTVVILDGVSPDVWLAAELQRHGVIAHPDVFLSTPQALAA